MVPKDVQRGLFHLSVGDSHSCATNTSGMLKCWGDNEFGQLNTEDDG